jgi:ferrous iron transport protein A
MTTLADIHRGQKARITTIRSFDNQQLPLTRRLMQLGFNAGIDIEILHEGYPKRDPLSVRVGNHTIALRRTEAHLVNVELVS